MRGHPLIESLILLICLALLALPLQWVIQDRVVAKEVPTEIEESDNGHLLPSDILLRSAHPYSQVSLTVNGEEFTVEAGETELQVHVDPHRTIEIDVSAEWPEGTPETALYVELAPEWHDGISHTIWGEGSAFETLTFSWEGDGHE